MNLAQLIQSQNLARLLQALDAAGELTAGTTVRARLLSLDPDGTATAAIGDAKIALVLAGPQAKQAALQPGATLVLHLEAPEQPGGDLRATLLDIRQPGGPPAAGAPTGAQLPPTAQAPASTLPPSGGLAAPSLPAPAGDTASATASHPLAQPPAQAATSLPSATVVPSEHLSRLATEIASGRAPLPTIAQKPGSAGSLEHPEALSKAAAPPAPARAVVPGEVGQATLPPPVSPRAAIGPTLGEALMRQDSLAPLFANLRGLAEGTVALTLPKPLLGAIDQLLRQSFPADRQIMTGSRLQSALQGSGLFMEAHAAAGRASPPQNDLKAGLLALRDKLLPIIDSLSPRTAAMKPDRAPAAFEPASNGAGAAAPPRRDGALAAQPVAEPTLHPGDKPLGIATTLLAQTDAALDRIKLSQFASLPLEVSRPDPAQPQPQRWLAEVPLAFQHGTAILPLQVEKDPPRREAQGISPPLWRIRFALDVEPMGPLQGVVTLQGREVGVTLWAEREETSRLLRGAATGLETALHDADFATGSVDIHTGQPRVVQPTAGQFLDRLS